ncbi:acyltransferase family protein [Xanthobacter sp. V4C-4]|uniref:acyltransferase family protein n=1 Tax=Xanthobacter cornucopiae TaxID=3119924 RepID=UPI00372A7D10
MRYRADISGLRALAVSPVVLFHADPALAPGGYVGVDVFFVISGYLITSIIAADLAKGGFSLARFYDRRVRRILPAYVFMAVVTTLAALVLLTPAMLMGYGDQLRAASTFLANRYFLSVTSYFGPAAEDLPLLHTWSLAIEEQFYLFWPLLLAGLFHRRLRRALPYVVVAIIAVSLVLATRNAVLRPAPAFFNFGGRIWELALGAVLALGLLPRLRRQQVAEALAAAGVVMILGAIVLFNKSTLFPGATALVPTLGALFILWAGEDGRQTRAGRLLSVAPLVWVGLISYSLYLWHWPLLVGLRLVAGPHPPVAQLAVTVAAAVVLAAVSWRYVEAPFRHVSFTGLRGELRSIGLGVAALAVLVAVGFGLSRAQGLPGRASAAALAAERAAADQWKGTDLCLLGPNRAEPPAACRFGAETPGAPLIALWGDSLANHHAPALDDLARRAGFGLVQITKAGCSARLPDMEGGAGRTTEAGVCEAFRAAAMKAILADPAVRIVVVAGNWDAGGRLGEALDSLAVAVAEITASGRGVIVMAPPVAFASGGGRCVARRRFMGLDEAGCDTPAADAALRGSAIEPALLALQAASPLVRVVIPRARFCDDTTCRPLIDGAVAMTDGGHLNVSGSLALRPEIGAALESLLAALPSRGHVP